MEPDTSPKILEAAAAYCRNCKGEPGEFLRLFEYIRSLRESSDWSQEELEVLKKIATAAICELKFNRYESRKAAGN